jgi:hypothetical protein
LRSRQRLLLIRSPSPSQLHLLLRAEFLDREIHIANDQADLSLANQFTDTRGLFWTYAPDRSQSRRISGEDAFDESKVVEQPVRESRTNAWQCL